MQKIQLFGFVRFLLQNLKILFIISFLISGDKYFAFSGIELEFFNNVLCF